MPRPVDSRRQSPLGGRLIQSPKTNSLLDKQLLSTLCSHLIFMFSETFFKHVWWRESSMWRWHQSGGVLNHSPLVSIRNLFISGSNKKKPPRPPWQFMWQCWLWKWVIFDLSCHQLCFLGLTEHLSGRGPQSCPSPRASLRLPGQREEDVLSHKFKQEVWNLLCIHFNCLPTLGAVAESKDMGFLW